MVFRRGWLCRGTRPPALSVWLWKSFVDRRARRCLRAPASRRLGMSRVFWDTNLFIYLLEGRGSASERTLELRKAMLVRGDQLLTSTLTLGEVLVKPIERGESQLYRKY